MRDQKTEFPYTVRLFGRNPGYSAASGEKSFLGSGLLVGPRHVITCEHVAEQAKRPEVRWNDDTKTTATNVLLARDQTGLDLALLELETPLAAVGAPLLWDLAVDFWQAIAKHSLWALGGDPSTETLLGEIDLSKYLEGRTREIQVRGGITIGNSGGPIVMRFGDEWFCVGLAALGRDEAATSRFIASDSVAEFLRDNTLQRFDVDRLPFFRAKAPGFTAKRINTILEACCETVSRDCEQLRNPPADASPLVQDLVDEHCFQNYIAPHYSYHEAASSSRGRGDTAGDGARHYRVAGTGDQPLVAILEALLWGRVPFPAVQPDGKGPTPYSPTGEAGSTNRLPARWLVVYDDAGAGKTVFSYRCLELLTSAEHRERFWRGKPPLVVRLHGFWPRNLAGHVLDLRAVLHDEVRRCLAAGESPLRTSPLDDGDLDQLLGERRVVLIVDGFDQFSNADREVLANLFNASRSSENLRVAGQCRWIITSRGYAIDANRLRIFRETMWDTLRIEPFSRDLQDRYLRDLEPRWRQLIPRPDEMAEELGVPLVLREIRRLVEETPRDQALQPITSVGELHLLAAQTLLKRALGDRECEDALRDYFMRVCGEFALQMMLEGRFNARVDERDANDPKAGETYFQAVQRRHYINEGIPEIESQQTRAQRAAAEKWDDAVQTLERIELKHRGRIEVFNASCRAFRNTKTMEWYAAWYLVNHASELDLHGAGGAGVAPLAVAAWAADPRWENCWNLAIDMPALARTDRVAVASLGLLFEPPTGAYPRPCELMWRALCREYATLSPEQQAAWQTSLPWLGAFRKQFERILVEGDPDRAQRAAQLVPAPVLTRYLAKREAVGHSILGIAPPETEPAYCECPKPGTLRAATPDGEMFVFQQGTAPEGPDWGSEKPRHPQVVRRFWLQATTVTRAQYRLFDPQHEKRYSADFDAKAKHNDCPVIRVDWHDAVLFSLWVGGRLPTESEWEFACRAGHDGERDYFSLGCEGGTDWLTSQQANFDGAYPYGDEQPGDKKVYVAETLPVRWTEQRMQDWLAWLRTQDAARAQKLEEQNLCAYTPNAWGLWQMHGNVWEWCIDVYENELYARRARAVLSAAGEPAAKVNRLTAEELAGKLAALSTKVRASSALTAAAQSESATFDAQAFTAGSSRVLRGGSWRGSGVNLRCAYRFDRRPSGRDHFGGFRLCWESALGPESS